MRKVGTDVFKDDFSHRTTFFCYSIAYGQPNSFSKYVLSILEATNWLYPQMKYKIDKNNDHSVGPHFGNTFLEK